MDEYSKEQRNIERFKEWADDFGFVVDRDHFGNFKCKETQTALHGWLYACEDKDQSKNTKRWDKFASAALIGLLACGNKTPTDAIETACKIADKMIEDRQK